MLLLVALDNNDADEVVEPLLGIPLDVEVDVNRGLGEWGSPEYVYSLVSHCEGLKGVVTMIFLRRPAFASPPRTKRMSELRHRKNALPGVVLDLLLAHP